MRVRGKLKGRKLSGGRAELVGRQLLRQRALHRHTALGEGRRQLVVAELLGRVAVQHPVAVVAAADAARRLSSSPIAVVTDGRWAPTRSASRWWPSGSGSDDPVRRHPPPALGEVPEREQQPVARRAGGGRSPAPPRGGARAACRG